MSIAGVGVELSQSCFARLNSTPTLATRSLVSFHTLTSGHYITETIAETGNLVALDIVVSTVSDVPEKNGPRMPRSDPDMLHDVLFLGAANLNQNRSQVQECS
jgi:hypothetical protein